MIYFVVMNFVWVVNSSVNNKCTNKYLPGNLDLVCYEFCVLFIFQSIKTAVYKDWDDFQDHFNLKILIKH